MAESSKIRIFGELWLPRPRQALSGKRLAEVERLFFLIQAFALEKMERKQGHPSEWDMDQAFERFAEKEMTWWQAKGVKRPKYLVRPSGHLDSRVAYHLYNSTFAVRDPKSQEIEDQSNCSMAQIKDAGFSSDNNCLIFDELACRERRDLCEKHYPNDRLEIHEEFTTALRDAMVTTIEVCWGTKVQRSMRKRSVLASFPLWGD